MAAAKITAKTLGGPETWKEALYQSVHRSTLPLKAIADALGIARSTLEKTCDEAAPDNLSSKHLAALAATADNHAWLDYLEARAGRHAFVLPAPGALCSTSTVASLKEFSEFLSAVADAVGDGSVTADDAARIRRDGLEAIAAINAVLAAAERAVAAAPAADAPKGERAAGGLGFIPGGRA